MIFDSSEMAFMVKTILRPEALKRLLESIAPRFPNAQVWIADDSPVPYPEVAETFNGVLDIRYFTFPEDIGIGHCYNHMIDRIETPYILLLDDDFIFTDDTRVERFLPFLRAGLFDLVGGRVFNTRRRDYQGFVGEFLPNGKTLNLRKIEQSAVKGIMPVEITMNFWAATTASLRATRWDIGLKVCRHEDFFLRYIGYQPRAGRTKGFRSAFYPGVCVDHENRSFYADTGERDEQYIYLRRGRFGDFRQKFVEKWGFEFV